MIRSRASGLCFPESPRWHHNRLWFVDIFRGEVLTYDGDALERVARIDDDISGLGFMPDGTPLVVSMRKKQILKLASDGTTAVHADLAEVACSYLNDMLVDADGWAFVDAISRGEVSDQSAGSDQIIVVDPQGNWRVGAGQLRRPNGLLLCDQGRQLIHASTTDRNLIAWQLNEDREMFGQRKWAGTGEHTPDGICLDAEGASWVGGLASGSFLRILEGGEVTDEISVAPHWATACALGGPDLRTLFMTTAQPGRLPVQKYPLENQGFLESVEVAMPAASI